MGLLSKMKPSTRASCDRCGSLRTEQRPLFTGMYTHCFACDGAPQPTVAAKMKAAFPEWKLDKGTWVPVVSRKVCYLPCGSNNVGTEQSFQSCSIFATLKEAQAAYPGAGVSELDFDFDTPGWVQDWHRGGRRWDKTDVRAKILSWVAA